MSPQPQDSLRLPPESASASVARRWLAGLMGDLPSEVAEDAQLLVTEVVTNAIIHAKTALEVAVAVTDGTIRVEVADLNPTLPTAKGYGTTAATGRGVTLLEALAACWGTQPLAPPAVGKVVWFEVTPGGAPRLPVAPDHFDLSAFDDLEDFAPEPEVARDHELVSVHVLGIPLPLFREVREQYDALFREFRLLSERGDGEPALPHRLIQLMDELNSRYGTFSGGPAAQLAEAAATDRATIDLEYRLPVSIGPATRRYDELLDEADRYCADGDLLTLAPSTGAVALRKWLLGEFIGQVGGSAPVPWADSRWCLDLAQA